MSQAEFAVNVFIALFALVRVLDLTLRAMAVLFVLAGLAGATTGLTRFEVAIAYGR